MARRTGKIGRKRAGVATGPRSVDGKKSSSLNSTTHGCRSERHVVLPGESAEEFEAIRRKWQGEYPTFNELDASLIERVAEREWHLRRCERMLDLTQERILLRTKDPFVWNEEEHRVMQLMSRYHSKAERSFRAAWQDIENLRRNRIAEVRSMEGAKRLAHHNVAEGISEKPDLKALEDKELGDKARDARDWYRRPNAPGLEHSELGREGEREVKHRPSPGTKSPRERTPGPVAA